MRILGLGGFSSEKPRQVKDLEKKRKNIFKNHRLLLLWVFLPKKFIGVRLAYAYEGNFFSYAKKKNSFEGRLGPLCMPTLNFSQKLLITHMY